MNKRILALILALSLLLSSCGGGTSAASMHLRKTEGTVGVSDEEGKGLEPQENLGLYSGYGVDTQTESYAWIDLDDVKLVKLDEDSEIAITKEDKKLEVEVKSGSLFFNVTEPLADDETMNIRTSTMMVGIRGTCGWVVSDADWGAQVFLLEGTVEAQAAATGERVSVHAGEMARVTVSEDGETTIEVLPFTEEYIVPFVLAELEEDPDLSAAVLAASGLDALNPPDPAQRLREAYQEIVAQQTVYDHGAAAGAAYTANGIHYSGDAGLSEAFLSDLDGDGTQELVMVFRFHSGDYFNVAPLQKIEVYGQAMGHPVLYDTLDVTACRFSENSYIDYANQYRLVENGTGQTIRLYANYAEGGVVFENLWYFAFENGTFTLLENYREPRESDWDWLSDEAEREAETNRENLRPDFPEDVSRKQALLSAFVSYERFSSGPGRVYARLVDVNQDGEDELFMILARMNDGLQTEYYTWDGANLECTVLANEPGDVTYGRLIDMDQDGSEELIFIMEDHSAVAYSWKGTSWERILLHEMFDESISSYFGLCRDTVTGNIYLGCRDWGIVGVGMEFSYDSLTEHLDYSFYPREVVIEAFDGRLYEELTPEEQEEADRLTAEVTEKFQRDTERFVLIENIDLSKDSFESFEQLYSTVDEVRQQLTAR